MLQQPPP